MHVYVLHTYTHTYADFSCHLDKSLVLICHCDRLLRYIRIIEPVDKAAKCFHASLAAGRACHPSLAMDTWCPLQACHPLIITIMAYHG